MAHDHESTEQQGPSAASLLPHVTLLTHRYALAVDSRDLDLVAGLFSADSSFGRHGTGPAGARGFYGGVWATFGRSVHRLSNHVVDPLSDNRASGSVYCVAEQEMGHGRWTRLVFAYFDDYVREGTDWLFHRRRVEPWYRETIDGARREFRVGDVPSSSVGLPEEWPTWRLFWEATGSGNENAWRGPGDS